MKHIMFSIPYFSHGKTMPPRPLLGLDEKGHAQSIHVRNVLWSQYVKCFSGVKGDSASADITRYIERFLKERECKIDEPNPFLYENKIREKTKALKDENEQRKLLENMLLPDCQENVFTVLCDFAKNLGREGAFNNGSSELKDLIDVRNKLAQYQCNGTEDFNISQKLIFIHYLDFAIKRRRLEQDIAEYLRSSTDTPIG